MYVLTDRCGLVNYNIERPMNTVQTSYESRSEKKNKKKKTKKKQTNKIQNKKKKQKKKKKKKKKKRTVQPPLKMARGLKVWI